MTNRIPPVLILIFNRPDKVKQLVKALEKIKPQHIYISADGPRPNVPADTERCAEARRIATELPWKCQIHTNFSEANQGCKLGVSSGISWFFSQVESGIILEDDCIPHESFFVFSEQMLQKYKNHDNVMHISGTSFLSQFKVHLTDPYYFSRIPHIWGWATWKRAWEKYDIEMIDVQNLENKLVEKKFFNKRAHASFWQKLCLHVQKNNVDTWDTQWVYSILNNDGICITPSINMVSNVGFDEEATHTKDAPKFVFTSSNLKVNEEFEPSFIVNKDFDALETKLIFMPSITQRILSLFKKWYYLIK